MKKLFLASITVALCAFAQTSFAIPPDYVVTTTTGASIVPGTTDTGNHVDDSPTTAITLPFAVTFYDQTFTAAHVSSNGFLVFSDSNADYDFCLPYGNHNNVLLALGIDLYTSDSGSGQGIFTSVSGSSPNRIFNIEWRARHCCGGGAPDYNFEIRLYEGEQRIDFIYGSLASGIEGGIGVQRGTGSQFTQLGCSTGFIPASGTMYTFRPAECVTPPANMTQWFPGDSNTLELLRGDNVAWQNGSPSYAPGEVSGAFSFGGGGQFVSSNSSVANFGASDFTIDFWMQTNASGEEIVNKRPVCAGGDTVHSFEVRVESGGQISFELLRNGDNTGTIVVSNAVVNDGLFHHIAVERSGNTMSIYVDGVLDNSLTNTAVGSTNVNNGASFAIGGAGCSQAGGDGTATFAGAIDEIEIFNRALTGTEVASIYNAGGAGKCKPQGLYAADGGAQNPNCHLYLLNPNDGSVVRDIGPIGFAVTALAFDPTTGILYGGTGAFSPTPPQRSIITIDPVTGAGTLIGSEGSGGPLADITATSDGTLYGWGEGSDDLYTVNKSTGAATKVGEASFSTAGSGIAANSGNVLFFGGDRLPSGHLRTVDRLTGALSPPIAQWSGAPLPNDSLNAFAFDPNDVLYASNGGDNSGSSVAHLVTINTTTAVITDRGSTVPLLDAIAFGPAHTCDQNPPIISAPTGPIDARAQKKKVNGVKGAYVYFNVSAVDPEDGPVPAIASPPSGSFFPVGTTVVNVTATDSCGNTSHAGFVVTVSRKRH